MRISLDPNDWTPCGGREKEDRLEPGDLIGRRFAVWRVLEVNPIADIDLNDTERREMARWKAGYQEQHRPYHLVITPVRGPVLEKFSDRQRETVHLRIAGAGWRVQPQIVGERYEVCSCHGDPWPCRDVLVDRVVAGDAAHLEALARKMPGCCWVCDQPFTSRQKSVLYRGENVELPSGPPARFHTRAKCWDSAVRYEKTWLAADPRRERILTWPDCLGWLIVHGDGSTECRATRAGRDPDCQGHLTHDHSGASWCASDGPCLRGCDPETHPGAGRVSARAERRDALGASWPTSSQPTERT